MGRKPKVGGAKGKAKAARTKTTDPKQFKRFLEAAREVGVDETGEGLERAFARIATHPAPERAPASRHTQGSQGARGKVGRSR